MPNVWRFGIQCASVLLHASWQSPRTFPLLFPCSHLHHTTYQAGKGVNAVCNIRGDVATRLFPTSSINLWAWERMPREEEGARSKGSAVATWYDTQTPPALDWHTRLSSSWWLTALSSVTILRSSKSCPYPHPQASCIQWQASRRV